MKNYWLEKRATRIKEAKEFWNIVWAKRKPLLTRYGKKNGVKKK